MKYIKKNVYLLENNIIRKENVKENEVNIFKEIYPNNFISYSIDNKVILYKKFDGINLREWIDNKRYPLSKEYIKNIFDKMKDNIKKLHLLGIVHGDIKLSNFIYNEIKDEIYIIDFGYSHKNMDGYGIPKGTPDYCSPELFNYIEYNNESYSYIGFKNDIWALGICLYYLYLLKFPFGNELNEIINNIKSFYNNTNNYKYFMDMEYNIRDDIIKYLIHPDKRESLY